jgi:hypothetical protein
VYEPLKERLNALRTTHASRLSAERKLQEEVIDVVSQYDHYVGHLSPPTPHISLINSLSFKVTSMSRMFVDVHMQVTEMEEQVARLERQKREREAMTY